MQTNESGFMLDALEILLDTNKTSTSGIRKIGKFVKISRTGRESKSAFKFLIQLRCLVQFNKTAMCRFLGRTDKSLTNKDKPLKRNGKIRKKF